MTVGVVLPLSAQEAVEADVAEVTAIIEAQAAEVTESVVTNMPLPEVGTPPAVTPQEDNGIAEMTAIVEAAQDEPAAEKLPPPVVAPSEGSGSDPRLRGLVGALNRKQIELDEAKAEIVRLQGVVRKILEANRDEQFTMFYNMACVYKNQGQYDKAEEHFLNALNKKPDEPDVHYNLGILYDDDLKNADKARKHYQRFIELAPNDKDAAKVQEWLLSLAK